LVKQSWWYLVKDASAFVIFIAVSITVQANKH
jgi:hypothetical protein